MDIFESALNEASSVVIRELRKQGYKELRKIGGSLFHTSQQEGLPDKAIIITVHVDPDIGSGYKFRRTDNISLQEYVDRKYELYCYHINFDEKLERFDLQFQQVNSAYEILEFWDANEVSYEMDID